MCVRGLDLRPGGLFHYSIQATNGPLMWGKFVYREVVPQERIVFVNSFSDENGGVTRNPWIAGWRWRCSTPWLSQSMTARRG